MARYTGDDTNDEDLLLGMLQGNDTSGTQPAGAPARADDEGAAPVAAAGPDRSIAARKALGGYADKGTMLGFNTAMDYGDDKAANSMKNTFGRIASRYKSAPSSVDAIMADADFQRYFPGAKKVAGGAGDKIDFGGQLSDFESGVPVGVVDVGGAFDPANDSGEGWTWQDLANDGGGEAMMGGGGGGGLDLAALGGTPEDQSALAQVMAEIEALQQGQNTPMDLEALLAQLGGGRG